MVLDVGFIYASTLIRGDATNWEKNTEHHRLSVTTAAADVLTGPPSVCDLPT